jgi:predicted TIM-barrel fold metal-dependent hydrolase
MRVIAVEEAFCVTGAIAEEAGIRQYNFAVPGSMAQEWFRRLEDLTELRLADMDANGVDMQVLSLSVPGLEVIKDPSAAVTAARRVNDYVAKAVAENPSRFAGFATLPLQDPQAAVVELRRAVEELGLKGVLYNDHAQGHYLDEPQFRPVWAELERHRVTLYLHPAVIPADNWRVFEGYPVLSGPTWGWTATVGAQALRIIYGGVFDEYPGASLTLGHMGELLPFQMARLDSRYGQVPAEHRVQHLPSHYLRNNVRRHDQRGPLARSTDRRRARCRCRPGAVRHRLPLRVHHRGGGIPADRAVRPGRPRAHRAWQRRTNPGVVTDTKELNYNKGLRLIRCRTLIA